MNKAETFSKVFENPEAALEGLSSGSTVVIAGYTGVGVPESLIRAMIKAPVRELTCVCQGAWPHGPESVDVADLVAAGKVRKLITPLGFDPAQPGVVKELWESGQLEIEAVPQGVLAELLRAGGAGLGGVFIPDGMGTRFEDNREVRNFDGRDYIFWEAIRADFALLRASVSDTVGNLVYRGSQRNWNPPMAMSARISIAEVDQIFEPGGIDPELVITPGIFVNRVVQTV